MKKIMIITVCLFSLVSCEVKIFDDPIYYRFTNENFEYIPTVYDDNGKIIKFKNQFEEEVKLEILDYRITKKEDSWTSSKPYHYYQLLTIELKVVDEANANSTCDLKTILISNWAGYYFITRFYFSNAPDPCNNGGSLERLEYPYQVNQMVVNSINYDKVVITTGGYFDDNIWLTNNGGIDWVERSSGIPALHINCLAWHPEVSNWIYAGTDMGIMASEDNGQNWNTTPSFLETSDGPAFVEISDIGFTRENTLGGHSMVVTTYGRGMWKSKYLVNTDLYVDENSTNVIKNGRETTPFLEIQDAEERQAHGQTWHVDGGTYEVDTSKVVIIDKRIGELKLTGTGAVIIGEN